MFIGVPLVFIGVPLVWCFRLDRLYDDKAGKVKNCSLHGFADASKKAYCAMIYLVYETEEEEIVSNLVCAKTRVAPLKELSIPRLELMSARILATLMNVVLAALNQQVQISTCRFWLDSKTALYWIKNTGQWRQFVQHRVDEILKMTEKGNWGHCAGICNPADLGSRGAFASAYRTVDCGGMDHIGLSWAGNIGQLIFCWRIHLRLFKRQRNQHWLQLQLMKRKQVYPTLLTLIGSVNLNVC